MKSAQSKFDDLRSRARRGILFETLAWIVVLAVGFTFFSYGVDRLLRLGVGYRALLLLGLVAGVAVIVQRRWFRPTRVELGDEELALAVERQDPELHQSLISAVQFEQAGARGVRGESERLMEEVVEDVRGRLDAMPFARAIDGRRVRRALGTILTGVVLLGSWAVVWSDEARLWAARNLGLAGIDWPRATALAFLDAGADGLRIAERDDVTIRVRAAGRIPDQVELHCAFAGGDTTVRPMERIGKDTFTLTLDTLLEDVEVHATGGDGISDTLSIHLVPRPRVGELAVRIGYPAYLRREETSIDAFDGDVLVPRGSTLTVTARADKPLLQATLLHGDDLRVDATLSDDARSVSASWVPETSGIVRFDVVDRDRLGAAESEQAFLQIVDDRPPRVEFASFGIGSLITHDAKIPGRLELQDDHGLTAVEASFRLELAEAVVAAETGDEPTEVPSSPIPEFTTTALRGLEEFEPGTASFESETLFDLLVVADAHRSLGADPEDAVFAPGQLLALRVTTRDAFEPDAHVTSSETLHFRIVEREKLIEELRRRQAEQRRDLEGLLERERNLRAEVAEATLPAAAGGDDPRRGALAGIARRQQAVGRRLASVADRYQRILDEFLNNRLLEPNVVRGKHTDIVSPLRALAESDFPATAAATEALTSSSGDALRSSVVSDYDSIIRTVEHVLASMEKTEDLALLLETLRIVIKTEEQAAELVEKRRSESVEGLFGPEGAGDGGRDDSPTEEKNR